MLDQLRQGKQLKDMKHRFYTSSPTITSDRVLQELGKYGITVKDGQCNQFPMNYFDIFNNHPIFFFDNSKPVNLLVV